MKTDEEKISSLYQKNKKQGSPEHIDQAILGEARKAIQDNGETIDITGTPIAKSPFSGGWPAIASIAAVLIISIILIPLVNQESPAILSDINSQNIELKDARQPEQESDKEQAMALEQDVVIKRNKQVVEKHSIPGAKKERQSQRLLKNTFPDSKKIMTITKPKMPAKRKQHILEKGLTTDAFGSSIRSPSPRSRTNSAAETPAATMREEEPLFQETQGMSDNDMLTRILTPEQWLKKIQHLINQGNFKIAQQELDAFIAEYPDEKINQLILDDLNKVSD